MCAAPASPVGCCWWWWCWCQGWCTCGVWEPPSLPSPASWPRLGPLDCVAHGGWGAAARCSSRAPSPQPRSATRRALAPRSTLSTNIRRCTAEGGLNTLDVAGVPLGGSEMDSSRRVRSASRGTRGAASSLLQGRLTCTGQWALPPTARMEARCCTSAIAPPQPQVKERPSCFSRSQLVAALLVAVMAYATFTFMPGVKGARLPNPGCRILG
mmetsp:Transcript_14180/g.42797  ORF Transcript_14180/g.42797 Transcript_14180/m.42797 type:complete len:212 (+) Transcript_14180:2252-2887(+)